jgi:hypothetical protein
LCALNQTMRAQDCASPEILARGRACNALRDDIV